MTSLINLPLNIWNLSKSSYMGGRGSMLENCQIYSVTHLNSSTRAKIWSFETDNVRMKLWIWAPIHRVWAMITVCNKTIWNWGNCRMFILSNHCFEYSRTCCVIFFFIKPFVQKKHLLILHSCPGGCSVNPSLQGEIFFLQVILTLNIV